MNHLISKTINPKETILFIYGNLSEVARQFAEMLKYCKKKKLHVVDIFFDTSIRRICFVIGILLAIIPIYVWYINLSYNFYNETYENIVEFGKENKYNTNKQKEVYNKYPADIGAKNLRTFNDWKNFMLDDYGDGYKARRYYLEQCHALKHGDRKALDEIWQDDEGYKKLQEFCPKFKNYMLQKISISKANYLYLLKLLWSLFWFYLPFLLACMVRWIYTGFKEK